MFSSSAPKIGFGGGFGAPSTGLGGFASPTASNGSTSFQSAPASFGSQAAPTSGISSSQSSTSGFGTSQAPLSGFGVPQSTSAAFGGSSAFTTAPTLTGFSGASNAFTSSASVAQATTSAAAVPQITLLTRFTDLPEGYRNMIEQTNSDYKKPMRDGLDEIDRCQPKILEELRIELGRTNLAALKLRNQQDHLLAEIRSFHDKAKDNLRDVRKYGTSGLQQIQNRGGLGAKMYIMREELPTDFYCDAADQIESRMLSLMKEVQHISHQLTSTLNVLSYEEGQYGQQARIGPQQLVGLIKRQSEAFARVASSVAEVHRQADEMRSSFLKIYCVDDGQRYHDSYHGSDPFAAADRAEAASERAIAQKLMTEESNWAVSKAASTAATAVAAAPAATIGASPFNFSLPGASSAPTAFAGLGANPFGSFSAAPLTTPAPGGFGTGFGSALGQPAASSAFGGAGFKALDLATTGSSLTFGSAAPAAFGSAFGGVSAFGGATTPASRKSNKNRK